MNSNPKHYIGTAPPAPPAPPPPEWAARIAAADMLYAPEDVSVDPSQMPMIGNGFSATQVSSDSIWVSGVFNGFLTSAPSHRARVPATNAVLAPGTPGPAAIDLRAATYLRRSWIDPSPPGSCTNASSASCSNAATRIWVEQRWYAHRALPSVLVMEVQVLGASSHVGRAAGVQPFAMLRLVNVPGAPSADLDLASIPVAPDSPYSAVNQGGGDQHERAAGRVRFNDEHAVHAVRVA